MNYRGESNNTSVTYILEPNLETLEKGELPNSWVEIDSPTKPGYSQLVAQLTVAATAAATTAAPQTPTTTAATTSQAAGGGDRDSQGGQLAPEDGSITGKPLMDNVYAAIDILESTLIRNEVHDRPRPKLGIVLKSNGYGYGEVTAGRLLAKKAHEEASHNGNANSSPIDCFFVTSVHAALELRQALIADGGLNDNPNTRIPIVILYQSIRSRKLQCHLANYDISVSVLSLEWLTQFFSGDNIDNPCKPKPLKIHLWVDLGMLKEGLFKEIYPHLLA